MKTYIPIILIIALAITGYIWAKNSFTPKYPAYTYNPITETLDKTTTADLINKLDGIIQEQKKRIEEIEKINFQLTEQILVARTGIHLIDPQISANITTMERQQLSIELSDLMRNAYPINQELDEIDQRDFCNSLDLIDAKLDACN